MPYHSEKSVGLKNFFIIPKSSENPLPSYVWMLIYVCWISFKWSTIFLSLAKYILYNLSGFLWYGWTYNAYWQWTSCNSFHCFNPIAFRLYSWRHNSELINVALTGSWLFLPYLASDLGKATFTGMESKLKLIRLSLTLVSAVLH